MISRVHGKSKVWPVHGQHDDLQPVSNRDRDGHGHQVSRSASTNSSSTGKSSKGVALRDSATVSWGSLGQAFKIGVS